MCIRDRAEFMSADPHLKATQRLLWVSGILFVIALATPYRPQKQPLISQVHVGSAAKMCIRDRPLLE